MDFAKFKKSTATLKSGQMIPICRFEYKTWKVMNTINKHFFNQEFMFSANHLLFSDSDMNEACKKVGQIFQPHTLSLTKKANEFSASMYHIQTGALSISRLEYGTDVIIAPNELKNFYLIQIPIQGYAEIEFAQQHFISYNNVASLISPDQSLRMRWQANAPQLILKINQQDFLQHCKQHIVDLPHEGVVFDPRLDFSNQGGSYFLQLLNTMLSAIMCEKHPLHHPLAFKQFESSLFNALIYGQSNNILEQINNKPKNNISPYFIKLIQEYIHAHLHDPLNIETLANHAAVSVRTLFSGFKTYLGTTPMSYLRDMRYEQVYLDLMRNEDLSVTDIAFKWGFCHLGRFSQEYKRRYGESPSQTLKSKQGKIPS